ncbi:DUF1287 domain-containing protein [Cytobacillus spongiae]|uniref:DUF1287 domain-containing protein n=1 Tax=Cytobacillus spongiae TaxID=2901381 RepID=UPI001F2817D7|nr:DUF1287 domain-containing protein [Cytobacillus spongiae]UII57566.1 DUF1287 domain-containing protein [Cytobacillus spongiae]
MKRLLVSLFAVGLLLFVLFYQNGIIINSIGISFENPFKKAIEVPDLYAQVDINANGIADPIDIVQSARKEVDQKTLYKSEYYAGGYPPEDEGVCTDVIWRGFHGANITLKDLMDQDISANVDLYPRVAKQPDPNIDFRRVPNQDVFFRRYAESLTTDVIPGNAANLEQWQAGDIVVFLSDSLDHIGIISDKRTKDGIPYVIHNTPPFAAEIKLTSFQAPITGHYRWKF